MQRCESFVGRLLLLCVSNIGLQALGFVYRIFLSRFAGAEGLGVYRLAFSVYIVIHAASLSGVTMACTRLSAEWSAQGKAGAIRILVRRAFETFLCFFLCCTSILFLFGDWIGTTVLGDVRTIASMPVLLLCIGLTGIENILKSTMVGMNRVDNAAASELIEQIVRIAVTLALLSQERTQDLGRIAVFIFLGMTISECVSATIMVIMYRKLRLPPKCKAPTGRMAFYRIVFPVAASALLANGIASAGAVFLPSCLVRSGLSRPQAVAELGVVSGIASPIMLLPIALLSSLCTVAMPQASRYAACGANKQLQQFVHKSLFATGMVGIPATALLIPLAPTIGRLFFYRVVPTTYFWLIGISAIFCYYQMITGCLLNGIGQEQFAVSMALSGELIQLGLVFLLAVNPNLRVHGYLLAQCLAPVFVTGCNLWRLVHCHALRLQIQQLVFAPITCGVLIFLWTRIFYSYFWILFGGQWIGLVCAVCSASILYVLVLRLFGIRLSQYLSVKGKTNVALFY